MNDNSSFGGLFRQHKPLETAFLALGLALFIFIGARGLQKIGDMRVAAGEAHRSGTVQADAGKYSFQSFGASNAGALSHYQLSPASAGGTDAKASQPKQKKELPDQAKANASPAATQRSASTEAKGVRPSRTL